jgi:large repetitive protein
MLKEQPTDWLGGNTFSPSLIGDASVDVTAQVFYRFTDAKGCISESPKQSVDIHPLPTPSITNLNAVYCHDSPDVVVTGNPAGGTFSISGPAGLDYTALPGSGSITIRPTTSTAGLTYTIHYTYSDVSGCTSVVSGTTSVVNLNAGALSFDNLSPAYCQTDAAVYTIHGLVNGASVTVAGGFGILSGNGILQTVAQQVDGEATFSPTLAGVGVHTITFNYTSTTGCVGVVTMDVVVGADLQLTGLKPLFCAAEPSVNLVASPAGGRFDVLSPSGALYTVNNSSYVLDPSTLMATYGAGVYNITYVLPNSPIGGCEARRTWQTTISAMPNATINGLQDNYCINDAPPSLLQQQTAVAGDAVSFSGPGVSGNYFNPSIAGVGSHSVLSQVVNASGCVSTSSKSTNVVSLPALSFVDLHDACEADAPFVFTVSNATDVGTFTFNCYSSVSGQQPMTHIGNNAFATFDPSVGEGVYIVEYTFVPDPITGTGCGQTITQSVTVHRTDPVSFGGLAAVYCQSDAPGLLSGSFGSGEFSSNAPGNLGITNNLTAGVPNGTAFFDPSALLPGNYTITYSFTNAAGCVSTASRPVQIIALPQQFNVIWWRELLQRCCAGCRYLAFQFGSWCCV